MRDPKPFGLNELREMFLKFFETKEHLRLPSFSLIPQNDASLLLINSGMAPMKPWFTGEQEPPRHRVCTCQKCIRTGDIENIGKTARHGTYFEMLGNFSFGDYFKKDAIHWAWEFLTSPEWVGLDPERLYPSVFAGNETTPADDEAFAIWRDEIGIPEDRIFKFGKEDNFWEHGSGPCGPLLRDLLRPGPRVGLRQARLYRGLRLRPVYRGVEYRLLPVRQRRRGPLHRAQAEEHRHRHGSGAPGLRVPEGTLPV